MTTALEKMMTEMNVKPEQIWLPAGGVAVFGLSGSGKSSLFHHSELIGRIIIADTGSLSHKMFAKKPTLTIESTLPESPIDQVFAEVEKCRASNILFALDSFTTLQEVHVAWHKRVNNIRGSVPIQVHQGIVGRLKDLALVLAVSQGFTLFNTTPGGVGKSMSGEEIKFPAGAITGYPSLSGVGIGAETILSRWATVTGVCGGREGVPRGLFVPGSDIRPPSYATYSPLKDPTMTIHDNTKDKSKVMAVPDLRDPANSGRCFIDEWLVLIASKFPKIASTQAATTKGAK